MIRLYRAADHPVVVQGFSTTPSLDMALDYFICGRAHIYFRD